MLLNHETADVIATMLFAIRGISVIPNMRDALHTHILQLENAVW